MSLLQNTHIPVVSGKLLPKLFWVIILASFIAWIVGLFVNPQGHQLKLFFSRMVDFWGDATVVTQFVSERNPYQYSGTNYPPLPYFIFYIFASVGSITQGGHYQYLYQPVWAILFFLFIFVNLGLLWFLCAKEINRELTVDAVMIGLSICLSGTMLFALERGNIIILSVVTAAIYIFYYDNNYKWKKEVALICLAISANIKLAPAVFGALLIYNKDWKAVIRVCIYGILLFILPFLFFKGGIHNIFPMFCNIYSFAINHIGYSVVKGTGLISSFFHLLKYFYGTKYELDYSTYISLRLISFEVSLLLFWGSYRLQEKWKQILNLTMVLLILPPVSHEYNILFLIPSIILFLKSLTDEIQPFSLKYSFDKLLVFFSFLMICFVFRCGLSDLFNQQISVLILTIVCTFYSFKEIFKLKQKQYLLK